MWLMSRWDEDQGASAGIIPSNSIVGRIVSDFHCCWTYHFRLHRCWKYRFRLAVGNIVSGSVVVGSIVSDLLLEVSFPALLLLEVVSFPAPLSEVRRIVRSIVSDLLLDVLCCIVSGSVSLEVSTGQETTT